MVHTLVHNVIGMQEQGDVMYGTGDDRLLGWQLGQTERMKVEVGLGWVALGIDRSFEVKVLSNNPQIRTSMKCNKKFLKSRIFTFGTFWGVTP